MKSKGLKKELIGYFLGNKSALAGADFSIGKEYPSKLVGNYAKLDLSGADLSNANFTCCYLVEANLAGANLTGASLLGANLIGTNFLGANLTGADLRFAKMSESDLTYPQQPANFSNANLTDANLDAAFLPGVNFSGANLTKADLTDAVLHGTNFTDTIFENTRYSPLFRIARAPVEIFGWYYPIIVFFSDLDEIFVRIGCRLKTLEGWKAVTEAQALKFPYAEDIYRDRKRIFSTIESLTQG